MGACQRIFPQGAVLSQIFRLGSALEKDSVPNLTLLPPRGSRLMNTEYLEIWAELRVLLIETLALIVTNRQRIVTI